MFNKLLIALPLSFLMILSTAHAKPSVLNGDPVTDGKGEAVVAIYHTGDWPPVPPIDATCGGVLVSSHWVLTAAHCVIKVNSAYQPGPGFIPFTDAKNLMVGIGLKAGIKKNADQVVAVDRIVYDNIAKQSMIDLMTPNLFAGFFDHDFVLLKLKTPLKATPISLPDESMSKQSLEGHIAYILGYRAIDNEGNTNGTLHQGEQYLLDDHDFLAQVHQVATSLLSPDDVTTLEKSFKSDTMIGVKPTAKCQHPMSGDSGGPLLIKNQNGKWTDIGVVSYGMVSSQGAGDCTTKVFFEYPNIMDKETLAYIKKTISE